MIEGPQKRGDKRHYPAVNYSSYTEVKYIHGMGTRIAFGFWLALSMAGVGCGNSGNQDSRGDLQDTDNDGIADVDENDDPGADLDGDGIPDVDDDDVDGDNISNLIEAGDSDPGTPPVDSDGDGTPDYRDTDSDDNGILDANEATDDLDGDGLGNWVDNDDDGDSLFDTFELDNGTALDTDGDGLSDHQDTDADGDTILDSVERDGDVDEDDIPNYLDLDSDGDCRPDAVEAGDADLETPPVNSDSDERADYLDLDSDGDGLPDEDEDVNCNGVVDSGESSATNSDTDGDGASDLVEGAAGTNPASGSDNPQNNGDFIFVMPYQEQSSPGADTLDFSTDIVKADIVFAMDTTGSMGQEINELKTSVTNLINSVQTQIPDVAFGVAAYRDFPTSPYGSGVDFPYDLRHRVMTTDTPAGKASVQAAVDSYLAIGGADGPESGFEMLYQLATGVGTNEGAASVPAFDPATAAPAVIPAGEVVGTRGGAGFRDGALPIVVWVTDACSHNSDDGVNDYSGLDSATESEALNALLAISARLLSVVSSGGACTALAQSQTRDMATSTDSVVPVAAWDGSRPSGCGVDECCTGENGVGEAPNAAGECTLNFDVNSAGMGLTGTAADAIRALVEFAPLDIGAEPVDDATDSVDAVAAFIDRIEANPSAISPCVMGLPVDDRIGGDGIDDTFEGILPGTQVCFDVVPVAVNSTVPATSEVQLFKATIVVRGDDVTVLDTREVFFLVPPVDPDIDID